MLLPWYSNAEISWFYLGNIGSNSINCLSSLTSHVSFNLLHLVCFYTQMTPPYTKDCNKTTSKTKPFSQWFMTGSEISSLFISCKKTHCFWVNSFLSMFLLSLLFSTRNERRKCFKIYFHKTILYVKEPFSKALPCCKKI